MWYPQFQIEETYWANLFKIQASLLCQEGLEKIVFDRKKGKK